MNGAFKNKLVHLSIGTIGAIMLVVFALLAGFLRFGRSAGEFESVVYANSYWIEENKDDVKKIPVIETKMEFLVDGMEKLTNTKFK